MHRFSISGRAQILDGLAAIHDDVHDEFRHAAGVNTKPGGPHFRHSVARRRGPGLRMEPGCRARHGLHSGGSLAADRLDAVFAAFEQAESSTSRRYGGSGLGLSISRALCEAMGFRLRVQSTLGAGTTFRVEL